MLLYSEFFSNSLFSTSCSISCSISCCNSLISCSFRHSFFTQQLFFMFQFIFDLLLLLSQFFQPLLFYDLFLSQSISEVLLLIYHFIQQLLFCFTQFSLAEGVGFVDTLFHFVEDSMTETACILYVTKISRC